MRRPVPLCGAAGCAWMLVMQAARRIPDARHGHGGILPLRARYRPNRHNISTGSYPSDPLRDWGWGGGAEGRTALDGGHRSCRTVCISAAMLSRCSMHCSMCCACGLNRWSGNGFAIAPVPKYSSMFCHPFINYRTCVIKCLCFSFNLFFPYFSAECKLCCGQCTGPLGPP